METQKDRTAVIALVAGGIALLLGLCLGALGGGITGYLIGRQVSVPTGLQPEIPRLPERPLTPELPLMPEMPTLPRGMMGLSGALVREVVAGSPAERAGLQVGDLIMGINNTPVDADHPLALMLGSFQPGERVTLNIWRAGQNRTLTLTLGAHPEDRMRPYLGIRYVDIAWGERGPQD